MKKIPSLFLRDFEKSGVATDEPNPECQWVFKGEGVATQKYDGTACMIRNGKFYKRRMVKKDKTPPTDFILAGADERTGKTFGWVPVDLNVMDDFEGGRYYLGADRWHSEAHDKHGHSPADGTYELCGPKIQGNPEQLPTHQLLSHDNAKQFPIIPRTFNGLKDFLKDMDIEGLVFHHPDGRMAKITKTFFGLER